MSEQIGEFTLKHSGCTFGTNSEGEMIANNNFVGEAKSLYKVLEKLCS